MSFKRILAAVAGVVLIVAGLAGLVFSIVGLVAVARVEPRVEARLTEQITRVDQALLATKDGLITADGLLSTATDLAGSLQETTSYAGKTLQDGVYALEMTSDLVGKQLPATIESVQESLTSISTSAQLIDDILGVLTAVPLLGMDKYSPETPLSQGFSDVARSLDSMPGALGKINQDLSNTQGRLEHVGQTLTATTDQIGQISTGVKDAQSVLAKYQTIVTDLQGLSSSALQKLPGWLRTLRWGLSLVLIWFGIAQIALLAQGLELIGRSRATVPGRPTTPEV